MFDRSLFKALMLIGIALPIASCTSSPSLTSIVVTPASMNFGGAGLTTQLTATGYYTHPNHPAETQNITDQVSWASSTPACVTVSSTGLITSGGNICSNIPVTASAPGFNGLISGSMIVNVTQPNYGNADIVSISVIPAAQTVASLNVPIQYEAVGTTAGGSTVALAGYPLQLKWASSNVTVATIVASTGLATTVGSGTSTITATFTNADGSGAVGTAVLTVAPSGSPEPLTSLTVSPNAQTASAVGQTADFLAIATTGSGSSVNLTDQSAVVNGKTIAAAVWTSSAPGVASIDPATGIATAVSAGAAIITSIATNPDGTVVTGTATYTVAGTTTTSAEPLVSMAIVPATQTALAANQTANFIAIGTTGSGSTVNLTNQAATINGKTIAAAVWSSSNPSVATVNAATGVATALSAGATAIVAIATNPDGTVVTGTAVYTVTVSSTTEPLESLAVVPASQTALAANQTAHFIAIGTTGSGATVNLTNQPATINGKTIAAAVWSSSSPAVATVDPATGIATALSAGATAITAIVTNPDGTVVSASAVYTVTISGSKEPVVSLAILPASQTSLTTGASANVNFIAIGTTASGTTVNLTNQSATINGATVPAAVWGSSNPIVASINAATGVATPKSAGATAITAIVTNPDSTVVSASAPYTVTVPAVTEPYVSLAIVPASQTVTTSGQQARYLALGITGTGATVDLTNAPGVLWTTSSSAVATIVSNGVAQAVGNGVAAVTAEVPNPGINGNPPDGTVVSASASLTVNLGATQEPLLSLSIQPSAQSVAGAPQTTQFLAIGDFSASSSTPGMQNMANIATYTTAWYSSNPQVASISATGVATAVGQGVTAITAIATNVADKSGATAVATFTVSGPSVEPISALSIFPGSPSLTLPVIGSTTPATVSFIAIGTNGSTGLQTNVNTLTGIFWTSTNPLVATIDNTGKATAIGQGTTTIAVTYTNPASAGSGVVTATTTLTVAAAASEPLLSVTIYPASPSLSVPNQTSQLLAIGTFSAPPITQDVTAGLASPAITTSWSSSNTGVATVTTACPTGLTAESCTISACPPGSTGATCTTCPVGTSAAGSSCATLNPATPIGIVTSVSQGTAAITSISSNPDKSLVLATTSFSVLGGSTEPYTALTIVPNAIAATSSTQQNQFIALATDSAGLQHDVTSLVVWKSNTSTVASICTAVAGVNPVTPISCGTTPGLVTAITAGSTNITATWTNPDNTQMVADATYSVAIGAAPEPLISINVVPGATQVTNKGMNQQYLAFGTFTTTPTLRDITDSVTWITLEPNLVSINSNGTPGEPAGLATAQGYEGLGVIYAEDTTANPDGTLVLSNPVTFTCEVPGTDPPICSQDVAPALLATLTVFNAGNNSTNWLITAPSDQNVANLIHCGPGSALAGLGDSVCTGTYAAGTNLNITAYLVVGGVPTSVNGNTAFGGWTANCDTTVDVPVLTDTCALPTPVTGGDPSGLVGNQSVGALFY